MRNYKTIFAVSGMALWWVIVFALCATAFAQSGVLTASRYAYDNWYNAGLPATITYGSGGSACDGAHANCVETNPNPWTPAARVQCGSTVAAGASVATINADIAACLPGTYVLLGSGSFTINATVVVRTSGVSLRGSGANSTFLNFSGNFNFSFGLCCGTNNAAFSTTSYAAGTTSITVTGGTGIPTVGQLLQLEQCDTGFSGSGSLNGNGDVNCPTGTIPPVDPGTIWVCGIDYPVCTADNNPGGVHNYQRQITRVTNVAGSVVTISPGLYMPNWSSNNTALMIWQSMANWAIGTGVEDLSANFAFNTTEKFDIEACYACRVKGNRIIGDGTNIRVSFGPSLDTLFANNYGFWENPNNLDAGISEPLTRINSTGTLGINNIFEGGICVWGDGQNVADVWAYNYCRDVQTPYSSLHVLTDHNPTEGLVLSEGLEFGSILYDDTHGTNNLGTAFRNYFRGWDDPYHSGAGATRSAQNDNYQRFDNFIGNALGGSESTIYTSAATNVGAIYVLGSDALTLAGLMRWGNCDVVNGNCRFQSSEVPNSTNMPGGTYPNATAFQNATPGNNNLPCSFFMQGTAFTTSPCPVLSSGGTGLSWWKVCTAWSTFPTSCSSSTSPVFPSAGPDISGGAFVNGHANHNPAALADINLPVDTTLQNSIAITSSSYSSTAAGCALNGSPTSLTPANCEILTLTTPAFFNGSASHVMGRFTPPAWNAACTPSGLVNGEIYITNSTLTQIAYALPSNPGLQCTGTMKFPNVRQFDESIYQPDISSTPSPSPAMFARGNVVISGQGASR